MQDEINEKTIALYIKTGKLTAQTLQKAMNRQRAYQYIYRMGKA